jgi:WD40 repeat protein
MSVDDELRQTEERITRKLLALARDALSDNAGTSLPLYLRRHLAEHAHAAAALDGRILNPRLLPYLDAARIRQLAARYTRPPDTTPGLWTAFRHVTHLWDFTEPEFNAAALEVRTAVQGNPLSGNGTYSPWRVRWARWTLDQGEILARHIGPVFAVATAALPDNRTLAVTVSGGGAERTMRVLDLATGDQIGDPLTGRLGPLATAVLPDGRALAVTGGSQGRVWDLLTGEPVGVPLTGQIGSVATAVLPDGRALAVTGSRDGTARVWNMLTGEPVGGPLTGHTDRVERVATAVLSDDYALAMTGSRDGTVQVWDLATGEPVGHATGFPGRTEPVAAAVLPDGHVLAVMGGIYASVWDLDSGELRNLRTGHTSRVFAMATAVLPDGRAVAITGGRDGTARVWDLINDEPTGAEPTSHTDLVGPVVTAVLPGGHGVAATGSRDGTVRVWDLATGEPRNLTQTGRGGRFRPVATATLPDGRIVLVVGSGGHFDTFRYVDGTLRVWDPITGEPVGEFPTGEPVEVLATGVLPDGRSVAVGVVLFNRAPQVWDLVSGELVGELLTDDTDSIEALATAVLPDGRGVAVGVTRGGTQTVTDHVANTVTVTKFEARVRVWDLATGEPVCAPPPNSLGPVATAVLPDGRAVAVTGSRDGTVQVWDLTTGEPVGGPLTDHTDRLFAVATAVLPDGRAVAVTVGWHGTVRVWDLTTGQPIGPALPTVGVVHAVATTRLSDGSCAIFLSGDGVAMATFHPTER